MSTPDRIADAISSDVVLSEGEREAVLEIALLAISADRSIDQDERVALRSIAAALGGEAAAARAEADVDALIARGLIARDDADARLRELAPRFRSDAARGVAYKAALAVAKANRDDADEEFEFDLQLIDALDLSQEAVDALAAQVSRALDD
jgi:hypothetical protein